MKNYYNRLHAGCGAGVLLVASLFLNSSTQALEVSTFCASHVPGKYILPSDEDSWTWGMAPVYDDDGRLHIFNSVIPNDYTEKWESGPGRSAETTWGGPDSPQGTWAATVVPIPAAAWLFGSALAGLGCIRRKQAA